MSDSPEDLPFPYYSTAVNAAVTIARSRQIDSKVERAANAFLVKFFEKAAEGRLLCEDYDGDDGSSFGEFSDEDPEPGELS